MSLYSVSTGNTIAAADIDQFFNALTGVTVGVVTINGLTVTGTGILSTDVKATGHFRVGGTSPTFTAGANAGTGAVIAGSAAGDSAGEVVLTTGTGPAAGQQVKVDFVSAVTQPIVVACSAKSATGTGALVDGAGNPFDIEIEYHSTGAFGGFYIRTGTALAASTTYVFNYIMIDIS